MPKIPTCAEIENATSYEVAFLALQKEFESPTFRLGGGRSIQLSYWSISLMHCIEKI